MTALKLAIPSKGRLKEQTEAYFASLGFAVEPLGGARGYFARIAGLPDIEVRLLSASEIASGVLAGDLHVGVSGEDLLREQAGDLERLAHLLAPLGFGRADLVVAVPKSWLDVDTMADIDDVGARLEATSRRKLRVATKYVRSTRRFFTAEGVGHYRIVESAGATEGAPAAETADIIVDITTTGATLASNGLKIIGDGLILASQAQLVASLGAVWTPPALAALDVLTTAIETIHGAAIGAGETASRFARFKRALTDPALS
jgi:ATP phosphoribosyltransferase